MKKPKVPTAKQLPSGSWFVRVRVCGKDICITRPTQKEAVAEAMAVKTGILEAEKAPAKLSVTQAIDRYIEARENVLSPSTVLGYRRIQSGRFCSVMKRPIGSVSCEQWQRIVNAESKLCSAKTLTNAWRFLSSVIFETTGKRYNIRLPQIIANERPYLTPEQIPLFVSAVHGTTIEIPALLALSSLRRSEITNLRWSDIDLDNHVLRVNGAAVYGPDGQLVRKKETKNRSSRRTVPLIPPLEEALLAAPKDSEYILQITPNAVMCHINRLCKKHGLPEVGLHGLRHSFASLAYHLNIPEKVAMEIGGWSNDQTMRKIYTHISNSDIQKHAVALTSFFQNGNESGNTSASGS